MGHRTLQGNFRPKNPHKYKGDPTKIVYRSSWEFKCMVDFDNDSNVDWWKSEEQAILYFDKSRGHHGHYYPDFIVHYVASNETVMYEIKPAKETVPPVTTVKTSRKRLLKESLTYVKNICKWEAARKWCAQRGYKFVILTERELFHK